MYILVCAFFFLSICFDFFFFFSCVCGEEWLLRRLFALHMLSRWCPNFMVCNNSLTEASRGMILSIILICFDLWRFHLLFIGHVPHPLNCRSIKVTHSFKLIFICRYQTQRIFELFPKIYIFLFKIEFLRFLSSAFFCRSDCYVICCPMHVIKTRCQAHGLPQLDNGSVWDY